MSIRHVAGRRHPPLTNVFTPVNGTYALIFDEEFNGSAVDTTKWVVHNSGTFNNAAARSANVTVSGSACSVALAGTVSSFTGGFLHTNGSTGNFSVSGANGNWYLEARLRMPAANSTGFWHAFWVNDLGTFPEIDMSEWRGAFPTVMPETYFNASGSEPYHVEPDIGLGHLGAGYHIYGCLWTPTVITFYVDGVTVGATHNGDAAFDGGAVVAISNGPYSINLTAGANGYGSNNALSASTTFPGIMKVDYIHCYQVGGTPITPQTGYGGPGSTAGPTL